MKPGSHQHEDQRQGLRLSVFLSGAFCRRIMMWWVQDVVGASMWETQTWGVGLKEPWMGLMFVKPCGVNSSVLPWGKFRCPG